jgi:peptidoglycan L-alanyl-D-glutamate endopeptidase CwlK
VNLNEKSTERLAGVHEDLVKVVHKAVELATEAGLEFQITEGVRSLARQRQLVAAGASTTMKSRHLTGDAFDFVPVVSGEVSWKWPAFWPLVEIFEKAAKELDIRIECGARWRKFPDGPHVQRPWK